MALAATGVGAGDLVAAAVSGSRYGYALVWAAALGALLKYSVSEGVARWQLATGTTLLEGWARRLGRGVHLVFLVYLVLWSFIVAGALISACGLAAHALAPGLSVPAWGALHSVAAAVMVLVGGYASFEHMVKLFIGLMFVTLIGAALLISPPWQTAAASLSTAGIPQGATPFVMSLIGGVGGSVTVLSYGYWMRERGWQGAGWLPMARLDLLVAYVMTGLFAVAVIVLSAVALHPTGVVVEGEAGVLEMAVMLEGPLGVIGRWTFLLGFWAAVATSMLGVWQGIPYLACDFVGLVRGLPRDRHLAQLTPRSAGYRWFLAWLALPPISLSFLDRPFAVIVLYTVMGALFMPFLAATLMYMNSRTDWVGREMRNRPRHHVLLATCLILFAVLATNKIIGLL